ncbi:MAG TPA: glycosyltransferase family 39 protein [Gammaproteobacteria bacterium]|nr:glycosyltransferase family 39 protein [Gammaproteobacteria bacterium]
MPCPAPAHPARCSRTGLLLLLIMAALIGASYSVSPPPEGHEAYVLQTTREMATRHDWIVPYFNGAPRLNKPPLNYWLTGAAVALGGAADVAPIHGRVPSILAGLGLCLVTFWLARVLFERRTALFALAIMGTSAGFYSYAHDARPDMLYAFLCALGYTSFLHALYTRSSQARWPWLMWLSYALATLSKGPHVPAMLLLAQFLIARRHGLGWRQISSAIRPVAGLLLLLLLTVPWWWVLNHRLGGAGLRGTQLGGSLLVIHPLNVLGFYYFYRTWQLCLPWVALWPALLVLMVSYKNWTAPVRDLMTLILIPAVLLGFGTQSRWFYMLPVFPAIITLMALATQRSFTAGWLWSRHHWLVPVHAGFFLLALLATWRHPPLIKASDHPALLVNMGVILGLAGIWYWLRRRWRDPALDLLICALIFASVYLNPGLQRVLWSQERYERAELARTAATDAASHYIPLIFWGTNPDIYSYYSKNGPVKLVASVNEIDAFLSQRKLRGAVLILLSGNVSQLPPQWHPQTLGSIPGKPTYATSVVRLQPQS